MWEKNGWRNAYNKRPENLDLIIEVYELFRKLNDQYPNIVHFTVDGDPNSEGIWSATRLAHLGADLMEQYLLDEATHKSKRRKYSLR